MSMDQTADSIPTLPSRRWGLHLLAVLGCLLLLLWAAPALVAWSPLVSWACDQSKEYLGINGSIRVGSVSLGWFSPITLHNLEVRDDNNHPVIQVVKITSDRSLLHFLLHRQDRGSFHVEKPS